MKENIRFWALGAHLGLLVWVVAWHTWLHPSPLLSKTFMLMIWLPWLFLPLPGLLRGRIYTYRWVNFILMPYILHSTTLLVTQTVPWWLCMVELTLALSAFSLNLLTVRTAKTLSV